MDPLHTFTLLAALLDTKTHAACTPSPFTRSGQTPLAYHRLPVSHAPLQTAPPGANPALAVYGLCFANIFTELSLWGSGGIIGVTTDYSSIEAHTLVIEAHLLHPSR